MTQPLLQPSTPPVRHVSQGPEGVTERIDATVLTALVRRGRKAERLAQRARWAPGRRVGPYEVERTLGEGASGLCLLAIKGGPRFGKRVCVKVLKDEFFETLLDGDGEERTIAHLTLRRSLDEARLQAHIEHPNVVSVYDAREVEGDHVVEMEYVQGLSLRDLMRQHGRRPMPWRQAVCIGHQLLEGALAIHEALDARGVFLGLVHRDLKPDNVMVDAQGRVKIADFGVAKSDVADHDTGNFAVGTLRYMPPEQLRGLPGLDGRADLYAIGVMLYEMLSGGEHPLGAMSGMAEPKLIATLLNGDVVPLRHRTHGVPKALCRFVDRLVAARPEGRFSNAAAALGALLRAVSVDLHRTRVELAASICTPDTLPMLEVAKDEPTTWLSAVSARARAAGLVAALGLAAFLGGLVVRVW